jgi:arginyl-tRNA synthetase
LYRHFQRRLSERVRQFLKQQYGVELDQLIIEQPPAVAMGEYALPLAFELARRLRKAPNKIAEEIVAGLGAVEGFSRFEVAGPGYINARLDRAAVAAALVRDSAPDTEGIAPKNSLVEHTSINPNKAAHIGHLRNSILGDTFVRLLRAGGSQVSVQNYIDNTGVQVADVVVGFTHLEKRSRADVEALLRSEPRIDFYCWDLYAQVSRWYEEDKKNLAARAETLHAIEAGNNGVAAIADLISTAVLRRHLETMLRLGIEYDFLPRESEILHLHFWDAAFELMKAKGVVFQPASGKKAGCWVMLRRPEEPHDDEENQEVLVRSNGTVTYVGKDIAYHLWKFGLLPRDFGYRPFFRYPGGHQCWISAESGEPQHPHFGGADAIYNVIDARQSDAQNNVIAALRAMGHTAQAGRYTHFSYEMVALTPRCAAELGYELSAEDAARAFLEVSGRKGFGVKADDLIDALITAAQREVDSRHPDRAAAERRDIATQIAIGALRYFMLKFTKTSVIAFDFRDALSFEGETGPYAQYAVVRAANIFRKAGIEPEAALVAAAAADFAPYLDDELWQLWLTAAKASHVVDQCISTAEPAYAAKFVFQLAQLFNNFYHRHHILTEPDPARKTFLLATSAVVRRELIRMLDHLGISAPAVM